MTPAYRVLCSVRSQLVELEKLHRETLSFATNEEAKRLAKARVASYISALAIVEHEIGMLQS